MDSRTSSQTPDRSHCGAGIVPDPVHLRAQIPYRLLVFLLGQRGRRRLIPAAGERNPAAARSQRPSPPPARGPSKRFGHVFHTLSPYDLTNFSISYGIIIQKEREK